MKRRRLTAALTSLALVAAPAGAQPSPVGINAAVRNKVEIRGAGTNRARPAVLRERVMLNDEVRTGAASQLQILLLDRSTFTVGASARVAVDRFVYDPAAKSRSMGVSVTRGAFRFMSGRALGKPAGPVSVRTPIASIGIRGTIFEGVVGEEAVRIAKGEPAVGGKVKSNEDEASLIVLRGPGSRTQGDTIPGAIEVTGGGRTVTLDAPGYAVYAPRSGVPMIGPFPLSAAGLAALQALLRPSAQGGGGGSHTARNAALIGAGIIAAGVLGSGLLKGKKKPKLPNDPNQQQKP
jgi:FecR protein